MSLDLSLVRKRKITYDDGEVIKDEEEVFWKNITHNLSTMADECGLYVVLWSSNTIGITKASECIPILEKGIENLKNNPSKYKKFNPDNGWGDYDGLLEFSESFLEACRKYPNATINISK